MAWADLLKAAIGGGLVLAAQALGRLLIGDVAKRLSLTVIGIRTFDRCTLELLRHPLWSGTWEITWVVESPTFVPTNTETGRLYRCFNSIALEGIGETKTGNRIPYGFVGKLSRDKTLATGTWFDRRGGDGGYHGAFQVRALGNGHSAAGLWLGFSETSSAIKADKLSWLRVEE